MGGMAIGSWLVSRYTQRIRNLLLGYAIAEMGIGLLALVFHRAFISLTGWAFDTVMPALGASGVDLFKWSLASALILPASVLLGTTFPLMSAGVMRLYGDRGGRSLSMLYFTNSLGAAIGVLVSGFFLIDRFGLPGTVLTAGIMNVVLALIVGLIARRLPVSPNLEEAGGGTPAAAGASLARVMLAVAFFTGAASFIYEVTWIRMLSQALGASTQSFEVMLAAFIFAMAMGAYWFRNRIGALKNDIGVAVGLLFAKAFFAVCALWVYGDVLRLVQWLMSATARSDGGYVLTTLGGMAASMLVMFPTAFCAGMTLPLATRVLTSRGFGEASIGRIYGANTAGCILGAVFSTHIGMELAGVKGLTGVGALLDGGVGLLLLVVALPRVRARWTVPAGLAAAGAAAMFAFTQLNLTMMTSGVSRHGQFIDPAEIKMLFYRDGKTATISVLDNGSIRSIRTNGKPDAGIELVAGRRATSDEYTMVLAAALPLATKPGARDVANIGFGSGITSHGILGSAKVRQLDTIEIERMVLEGARHFQPRNERAFHDARSRFYVEDAKTFFAARAKRYDVIVSEPSNPWVSGTSTLFSEEFYAQLRRYLKDDGILVQWVQAYEIDVGLMSTIFKALGSQMGDYAVYGTGTDLLVVATPAARLPELSPDIFLEAGVKSDLAFLGIRDIDDLRAQRVAGRGTLEPLFARSGYPANSDYFPVLDQNAPRARFKNESAAGIHAMRSQLAPVVALLDGESRTRLSRISVGGMNRPARIDNALLGAEALGVALSGNAQGARALDGLGRASALIVNASFDDCKGRERDWVDAVTEVSRLSMPYLDAAEVAPLFRRIRASRCWKSLGEVERARIELLEAMNERDPRRIVEAARKALDESGGVSAPDRASIVAVAIVASIVRGEVAAAREIRDRYIPGLARSDGESLLLNLALAHLSARSGWPR